MDTQFSRLFVYYLRLRLRTINRKVRAWGMVPWVFWACVIPLFLLISWNLVERGLYMRIAYLLAGLSLTQIALNQTTWLRPALRYRDYNRLLLLQNLILLMPFLLFIVTTDSWYIVLPLLLLLPALPRIQNRLQISLPGLAAFSRNPYEFAAGIRRYMFPLLGMYSTIPIAWFLDNSNFLLPGWAGILFLSIQFYQLPDPEYFVWNHRQKAPDFLRQKIKLALIHSFSITSPILFCFLVSSPERWWLVLAILTLSALMLTTAVVARYVSHPEKMDFFSSLLLSISMIFPPLLIFTLPLFYKRSLRKLKPYLG